MHDTDSDGVMWMQKTLFDFIEDDAQSNILEK